MIMVLLGSSGRSAGWELRAQVHGEVVVPVHFVVPEHDRFRAGRFVHHDVLLQNRVDHRVDVLVQIFKQKRQPVLHGELELFQKVRESLNAITLRPAFCPRGALIQFTACICGSMHSANRDARVVRMPFCTLSSSLGSPSEDHCPVPPRLVSKSSKAERARRRHAARRDVVRPETRTSDAAGKSNMNAPV